MTGKPHWLLASCCWLMLLLFGGDCAAQSNKSVKLKRIFVPAGKPDAWPAGDWVPITEDRLQELLQHQARAVPRRVAIDRAVLSATFDPREDRLVSGRGELSFLAPVGTERLTSLAPSNLTWLNANWVGEPTSEPVMGTDDAGRLVIVLPDEPARLQFAWQLQGVRRLSGIEFDLRWPRALATQLVLEVPVGWNLGASAWNVQREPGREGFVNWRIECGQAASAKLLLSPEAGRPAMTRADQKLVYQQTTNWTLSRHRLETTYEVLLDPASTPGAELELMLPSEAKIDSIVLGGRGAGSNDVAETVVASQRLVTLKLPGSLTGTWPVLLRFSQNLTLPVTGISLPVPRVMNARAVMLNGRAELRLSSRLSCVSHAGTGLRQVDVRIEDGAERLMFQQDRPSAELKIVAEDREKLLRLSSRQHVLIDCESSPLSFYTDLEITDQSGGAFQTRLSLPRLWAVSELQQIQPVQRGIEWSIEQKSEDHSELVLSFADGLPVNSPVTIRLHGQLAAASPLAEFELPVALLDPVVPTQVAISLIDPPQSPGTGIQGGRFQLVTKNTSDALRSWSALAKLIDDGTSVWTANVWTRSGDVRDARLRLPINGTAPASPDPAGQNRKPRNETRPSPETPRRHRARAAGFQPVFTADLRSDISPGVGSQDHHALRLTLKYDTQDGLFRFQLPPGGQLRHVDWNGQRVGPTSVGQEWSVPMTSPQAGDTLTIRYLLPSKSLFLRDTYRTGLLKFEAPIVHFAWDVRLPSRFRVVSFATDLNPTHLEDGDSWLRWLFGPLARDANESFFNPLSSASWQPLLVEEPDRTAKSAEAWLGWTRFRAEAAMKPEALRFETCDRLRLKAFGWFILAATLSIGTVLRVTQTGHRAATGAIWLAANLAATVLVPAAYAELVGATILGSLLVGLVPRRFLRRELKDVSIASDRWLASTVTVQRASLTMLLIAALVRGVAGQDVPSPPTNAAAPLDTLEVLVEFEGDSFQQPLKTGLICVPSKALEQLLQQYAPNTKARLSPLIARHAFDGALLAEQVTGVASWDVWVPIGTDSGGLTQPAPVEVSLPLPLRLVPQREVLRIDGQPTPLTPTSDGLGIQFVVRPVKTVDSGKTEPPLPEDRWMPLTRRWRKVRVDVPLRVGQTRAGGLVAWRWPMVPCPRTEFRLKLPEGDDAPLLINQIEQEGDSQRLVNAVIDPRSELRLELPRDEMEQLRPDVELLVRSSCELHPSSCRHTTLGRYSVRKREVDLVVWRLPAGAVVQIERLQAPQLAATQVKADSQGTLLLMEFSPPHTTDFTVVIPWLLASEASGETHNIVWEAPVSPANVELRWPVSEHLAGVTPAPGWTLHGEQAPLGSNDLEEKYLSEWPTSAVPRRAAAVIDLRTAAPTRFRLQPVVPTKLARWHLQAQVDRDDIVWTLHGELDVTGGAAFQHDLLLDSRLAVEAVSIEQDDVPRLSHWTRREHQLTLHLKAGLVGQQTLRVVAREPLQLGQPIRPPVVALNEVSSGSTTDRTFQVAHARTFDVRVVNADLLSAAKSEAPNKPMDEDRINAGLYRLAAQQDPYFVVTQAQTEAVVWGVAEVEREADNAVIVLRLDIAPGPIESANIVFPAWPIADEVQWSISPPVGVTMEPSPIDPAYWTCRFGNPPAKRVNLVARIPLRSPEVMDDMSELLLPMPTLDGMRVDQLAWQNSKLPPVIAAAQTKLDEEGVSLLRSRQLLGEKLKAAVFDWKSSPIPLLSAADPAATALKLPILLRHHLQLGPRQQTSGISTLIYSASTPVFEVQLPENVRLTAFVLNGQLQRLPNERTLTLAAPRGDRHLAFVAELLWEHSDPAGMLRVAMREIPLPIVKTAHPLAIDTVLTKPRQRHVLSPDNASTSDTAFSSWDGATREWQETLARFSRQDSRQISARLKDWGDATPLRDDPDHDHLDDEELPLSSTATAAATIRLRSDNVLPLRIWIVDRRLTLVVLSIVLLLLSLPALASLMHLRSGEQLAKWPTGAMCILSTVWWLCLQASIIGWAVTCIASIVAVVQIMRHQSQGAASASDVA